MSSTVDSGPDSGLGDPALDELKEAMTATAAQLPSSPIDLQTAAIQQLQAAGIDEADWPFMLQQMAEADCAFYANQYLQGPPEPPYNGRFLIGEHHEEWSELIGQSDRLCVLAPRDHGKSFFFNLAYPIWMAEKYPGKEGFIFSKSQPQAEEILGKIADEIDSNPNLKHLRPASKARNWSSKKIRLANGHTIFARGYGTKVRGAHPWWIVVDDGLNDEDAYSEVVRKKNIDYFMTAVTNMIVPGGQIVVIGTPFHHLDLYGELERNEEYLFKRYVAWDEEKDAALWPERYNKERLARRRREIGVIRFQREFLCRPIGDESSLFPKRLFQGMPTENFQTRLGMPWQYWEKMGVTQRFIGVDFAMSTNVAADYTALFVVGLDKAGNRWIIDIVRDKGLGFQEQLSLINATAKKYNPQWIYCEKNAMQRIFGDELIRTSDLPIKNVHTGENKHSLEKGVPALRVLLENQKVRIPRGDGPSVQKTDEWTNEMHNLTFQNGKVISVGEHDDTAMAWYIAEQAIREGTFGFSFGEEDGDREAYQEVMAGLPMPDVDWIDDDEFYEEEMLDPNFVPGEMPRVGRPKQYGAQLVDPFGIEDGDKAMNKDVLLNARHRGRKRRKVEATPGRPPPGEEYENVKPKDGAPPASLFVIRSPWGGLS